MGSHSFEDLLRHAFNTVRNACVHHGSNLVQRVRGVSDQVSRRTSKDSASDERHLQSAESRLASGTPDRGEATNEIGRLELLGDSLEIRKELMTCAEVIIRKEVVTETQIIEVPDRREELVIEHRDKDGRSRRLGRDEAGEWRIVLSEERADVRTRPVVREVVRVSKRKVWEKRAVSESLRHEELRVEQPDKTADQSERVA